MNARLALGLSSGNTTGVIDMSFIGTLIRATATIILATQVRAEEAAADAAGAGEDEDE
jgi:hypothetical protein